MMYQYLHLYFVTFHLPSEMTWTLILRKKSFSEANYIVKVSSIKKADKNENTRVATPESISTHLMMWPFLRPQLQPYI